MVTFEIENDSSGRYNNVALERVARVALIETLERWLIYQNYLDAVGWLRPPRYPDGF